MVLAKNLTPLLFAQKACSTRPGRLEMTLVARGSYVLDPDAPLTAIEGLEQGFLSGELPADEDEREGEIVYPGDFVDFKIRGEVLLRGSCHTPGAKPVAECPVKLSVGVWSKSLRVQGQRFWSEGLTTSASPPRPFSVMPLSWANAFGGPGYAENPVGKGLGGLELPTVLYPGDVVERRSDRPTAPASFGPRNASWVPRAGMVGKRYDGAWLARRAPYLAEDFDPALHQSAPRDQQIDGWFRGDELIVLQNLHPRSARFERRLPRLRVRAFVHDREARFREVAMVLDTIFVDLDGARLVLTWRGLDEVKTDDLTDVTSVMLAAESFDEERSPREAYREQLLAFEKDPTGIEAAMPPELKALAAHERAIHANEVPAPDPALDPLTGAVVQRLGPLVAAEKRAALTTQVASARGAVPDEQGPALDAKLAAAAAALPPLDGEPPVPALHKPGHLPDTGLRRRMRAIRDRAASMRGQLEQMLAEVPAERRDPAAEARTRDGIAKLEATVHDPRWSELDPDYVPPEPLAEVEPGPGAVLVDHDLTRRDLSGRDLRGADLSWAILTRANLRGANLEGAKLVGALLFRADLSGANLTGADLRRCNGAEMNAEGASFERASLEIAFLEAANLRKARLVGARGDHAWLVRADLSGADLSSCQLSSLECSEAVFTGAKLAGADLRSGRFIGAKARDADFSRAKLGSASFQRADLRGARFVEARGSGTFWQEAHLEDADLRFAWLLAGHFTSVWAARADFTSTNLKDCRFDRAVLEQASFVTSNLLRADLSKAIVTRASFDGANLYEAKLLKTAGTNASFDGANLRRSTLDPWA